jgi:hypothetical protein
MKKSLVQKVAPWVFAGLSLIGSGCGKVYEIKNGKVKINPSIYNSLVQIRGDSLIKYSSKPYGGNLANVNINGIKSKEGTEIYNKEKIHYNYLKGELDSLYELNKKTNKSIDWRLIRFSRDSRNF